MEMDLANMSCHQSEIGSTARRNGTQICNHRPKLKLKVIAIYKDDDINPCKQNIQKSFLAV